MRTKYHLTLVVLLLGAVLHAQEAGKRWNVNVYAGAGYMGHGEEYDGIANSFWYPTADIRIGRQLLSDDPSSYAWKFNFPFVGLGVNWKGSSHFDWTGKTHLNDLGALYGFFERDWIRTRVFSFGYDFSLGVGFNSAVYDPEKNPGNTIFSSGLLVYLGPSLHVAFRPVPRLELGLVGRFTHMSTGRLAYPNAGFNGMDVMASVRYSLAEPRVKERGAARDTLFRKKMFYEVYAGYGVHRCSMEWDAFGHTDPWPSFTVGGAAFYRYSKSLSSGLGLDVFAFTDAFMKQVALNEQKMFAEYHPENYDYQPVCLGLSAIQQVHYGRFTAWLQIGAYLYKHLGVAEQSGYTYQRFGGKILFPELGNLYLGIACKCHYFSRATSLDFTLGVRI